NLSLEQVLVECQHRNISFGQLLALPEQDSWRYSDGLSLSCVAFALRVWKVAGVFGAMGEHINVSEFTVSASAVLPCSHASMLQSRCVPLSHDRSHPMPRGISLSSKRPLSHHNLILLLSVTPTIRPPPSIRSDTPTSCSSLPPTPPTCRSGAFESTQSLRSHAASSMPIHHPRLPQTPPPPSLPPSHQIRDAYQLQLFASNASHLPFWCFSQDQSEEEQELRRRESNGGRKGGNREHGREQGGEGVGGARAWCQLLGKWRFDLPGFNSIPLYAHMNEQCPTLPPTYMRPSFC
ncbi:unnamed protein product, partial [Closterium sp. Naga37s-1]